MTINEKLAFPNQMWRLGFPNPVFSLDQQRAVKALITGYINVLLQSGKKLSISLQLHFPF